MDEKLNVRFTAWEAFPQLELYMDQVLLVLNEALAPFSAQEGPAVTATMINNYVKLKLADPADKKKYNRTHVVRFFMICLLKKVLSMQEIQSVLDLLLENHTLEEAYGLFCLELEQCMDRNPDVTDCPPAPAAAIRAVAWKIQVEKLLNSDDR